MIANSTMLDPQTGIAPPPMNPLVAEIDRAHSSLSPDAQEAIGRAHGILGIQPPAASAAVHASATPALAASGSPAPSPVAATPAPEMPAGAAPSPAVDGIKAPSMGLPGMVGVTQSDVDASQPGMALPQSRGIMASPMFAPQVKPFVSQHQQNFDRLTATPLQGGDPNAHTNRDTGRAGVDQIHNPWARVPLQILDAVGRGFFPGFEMAIPGTQGHHDVLVNQAGRALNQDYAGQKSEDEAKLADANAEHLKAEATEVASRPELKQTQNDLKQKALDLQQEKEEHQRQLALSHQDDVLHQQGWKRDKDGKIVPLPRRKCRARNWTSTT
jgi:hypothetical protein